MPVKTITLWLVVGALAGLPVSADAAPEKTDTTGDLRAVVQPLLETRLGASKPVAGVTPQSRILHQPAMVRSFYRQRNFRPAWMSADVSGRLVADLLAALEQMRADALVPEAYHLASLRRLYNDTQSSGLLRKEIQLGLLVDLELLATDAFLACAGHLLSGRVAPEALGPEQQVVRKDADLLSALQAAIDSDSVQPVLKSFLPDQDRYRLLRRALQRYRQIERQGGWPQLADGSVLQPGRRDSRVPVLRSRLAAEGYLKPEQLSEGDRFDPKLKRAVAAFQRQHGLRADSVVGSLTREALNVPADVRVRQIELNMERWRWLPQYLGKRYLLVNIADFSLEVIDDDRTVMAMRVVVGKDYRRTRVLSAELNKLGLIPHWYVPHTIFSEDLLPAIQKNTQYLQQRGYRVFSSLGENAEEVAIGQIDWQTVDPENFPYILRKDPGPFNPMGRAKFLFPNKYEVYLHDSPNRSIFNRPKRTFSSGCIRIEKPLELTAYILKDSPGWSRKRIDAEIDSGRSTLVHAFAPLPIYIQYWTVWVDSGGAVQFREDIYGRDAMLAEALSKMKDF